MSTPSCPPLVGVEMKPGANGTPEGIALGRVWVDEEQAPDMVRMRLSIQTGEQTTP